MDRQVGDPAFPLWLLGDSNPPQWEASLQTPLDPRHPVRHNIWTSVLDVIQDRVYRQTRDRLDTTSIYIRNAVADPGIKPKGSALEWPPAATAEVEALGTLLERHRPVLLLSFGAFSFEFARRALRQEPVRNYGHWGARTLGQEFRCRIAVFDPRSVNALPLLHITIARGKFRESHDYFCGLPGGNYFEHVGLAIADTLVKYRDQLPIWVP